MLKNINYSIMGANMSKRRNRKHKKPVHTAWQFVGLRLKAWRKKNELTLYVLSKAIGVSQGSLSDLENGNSFPSFETLCRFKYFYPRTHWTKIFFS